VLQTLQENTDDHDHTLQASSTPDMDGQGTWRIF
jgi:hypothetical protein